jgi:hypothetical protein
MKTTNLQDGSGLYPLSGIQRNAIINGGFSINQRSYVSDTETADGDYCHDRWKAGSAGCKYTFATVENLTTITIPASDSLIQVIEGLNLTSGTYTLTWEGTAQGKIGAGDFSDSGVTGVVVGGTNLSIEFGPGTLSNVTLSFGSTPLPFEPRAHAEELGMCQRYYWVWTNGSSGQRPVGTGMCLSTTKALIVHQFPVEMQDIPIGTGGFGGFAVVRSNASGTTENLTNLSFNLATKSSAKWIAEVAANLSVGNATIMQSDNTGGRKIIYSAEL